MKDALRLMFLETRFECLMKKDSGQKNKWQFLKFYSIHIEEHGKRQRKTEKYSLPLL